MIFTAEDLCRVRVARSAQPTQELILSINSLRVLTSPPEIRGWRTALLNGARRAPAHWRCLTAAAELVPAGNFPGLRTPALDETDVGAHFETILSQPKSALREDIASCTLCASTATWSSGLCGRSWTAGSKPTAPDTPTTCWAASRRCWRTCAIRATALGGRDRSWGTDAGAAAVRIGGGSFDYGVSRAAAGAGSRIW
ncbi:hypothetical protein G3I59_45265 [Amycolatopsis rubida]|uniref:Uncharacterized protein n=1 Tax=Amycolatopsis rubida TaxID=112413 RepID=A0ABX0C7F2_9PSEU|nr:MULTISPECIES: hypothetical protein [Amycolatopsis]NEC62622.1 hypothetical protein [Amycolatopsis rubida]